MKSLPAKSGRAGRGALLFTSGSHDLFSFSLIPAFPQPPAIRSPKCRGRAGDDAPFFSEHEFKHSLVSLGYMLEEFCEGNHCDQYIPSVGGSFAQCLMVQRELSRVGNCPLRYDKIAAKAIPEVTTSSRSKVKGEPKRNQGFPIRSK